MSWHARPFASDLGLIKINIIKVVTNKIRFLYAAAVAVRALRTKASSSILIMKFRLMNSSLEAP